MYVFYLRVAQSLVHLMDDSYHPMVLIRETAAFGQVCVLQICVPNFSPLFLTPRPPVCFLQLGLIGMMMWQLVTAGSSWLPW